MTSPTDIPKNKSISAADSHYPFLFTSSPALSFNAQFFEPSPHAFSPTGWQTSFSPIKASNVIHKVEENSEFHKNVVLQNVEYQNATDPNFQLSSSPNFYSFTGLSRIRMINIESPVSRSISDQQYSDFNSADSNVFSFENAHKRPTVAVAAEFEDYNTAFLSSPTASPSSAYNWSFLDEPKHTTPSQSFLKQLESRGFIYNDVLGLGNCLFEALADQMYSDSMRHFELRTLIADEIKNNPQVYAVDIRANYSDVYSPAEQDEAAVSRYVDRIKQTGEVGDAICIAAFCKIFNADVAIYMGDGRSRVSCFVVEAPRNQNEEGRFLTDEDNTTAVVEERTVKHIAWYRSESGDERGNHYVSLYPPTAWEY